MNSGSQGARRRAIQKIRVRGLKNGAQQHSVGVVNNANFKGVQNLCGHERIVAMRQHLLGRSHTALSGPRGPALPFLLGLLLDPVDRPVLLVLQDEDELDSVLRQLRIWTSRHQLYAYPYADPRLIDLEHGALLQQMKSLRAMLEPGSQLGWWVGTLRSFDAACFSLDFIDRPVLHFEKGREYPRETLVADLEKRGFSHQTKVEQKGDYAVRGGIVDIFPRFAQYPVRFEFFGDELETLREFSVITQRAIRQFERFTLDDMELDSMKDLKRDGDLADYLPENLIVVVQEPELSGRDRPSGSWRPWIRDWLLPRPDGIPEGTGLRLLHLGTRLEPSDMECACELLDPQSLGFAEALEWVQKKSEEGELFLMAEYGSRLRLAESAQAKLWNLDGDIDSNFAVRELGVTVLHERHLVQIDEGGSSSLDEVMADFIDLEMGDYVVHEEYGIGQFLGLSSLEKEGVVGDYLLLQFAGGCKVYVSTTQLHLVQKFIGHGEGEPELSRVGSRSWELKKKKARIAIDRIVMELVHRQAYREQQVGFAFSADSKEQRIFEAAFRYTDTSCQSRAAAQIKRQMESDKAMDHLLCGDVGFGKTEVAMRAAHKAVLEHRQVAVLAPTTILAEQHYRSFKARFGATQGLAEKIGVVSRFHTAKENQQVLLKVAAGEVMVLIGTHRLLSQDVNFADLGLFILDEEQRFGVKQKEVLKARFPAVDVLSLSATPIPRTLHMAMLGIRTISNLTVPPENRRPIRTYIREFSEGIIRHAIERELERGGQTYFLHNRIEDIEDTRDMLQQLFPEARIVIGHGQMSEIELSRVMEKFYALEYDILLSTSIIASGIDMPTANTMIINDAHRFGLSELHQIRGRIGRYNIQAYAYLLIPAHSPIPQKSLRRLRAIEEHQELGAGFKLAMKDMEIRGVGNILGEDQHGQIADIGYELYTQYLSQAIAEAKGQKVSGLKEVELSWSVGSAYIPQTYIPSNADRIGFYRRISFARNLDQLARIEEELRDRFGILPPAAVQMMRLFRCKVKLLQLSLKSFKKKDQGLVAEIEPHEWQDEHKLAFVLAQPEALAFRGDTHILLKVNKVWNLRRGKDEQEEPFTRYSYRNGDNRLDPLEVLEELVGFCTELHAEVIRSGEMATEEKAASCSP